MPSTPRSALIITLCLVCCYFAISGIRMIAIAAGIMLPVVILLGYFVAIANTPEKDYRLLQPVLENGWQPAIQGMIYVGGGFVEMIMLLAVQHRIKSRVKAWRINYWRFCYSGRLCVTKRRRCGGDYGSCWSDTCQSIVKYDGKRHPFSVVCSCFPIGNVRIHIRDCRAYRIYGTAQLFRGPVPVAVFSSYNEGASYGCASAALGKAETKAGNIAYG